MKLGYILKNLKLYERNKEWLTAHNVSATEKAVYYPNAFNSLFRQRLNKKKVMKYFGRNFYYDNAATPLNLQNYPYEISNKMLSLMKTRPKKVLDIGANIGQFSCTLSHSLEGKVKIFSFEPNPDVFEILAKNIPKNVKAYNYGIGPNQELEFYFEPNRSGIGSLYKQNAGEQTKLKQITIKTTNKIKDLTGTDTFDLIKIDVEGFEYEVIKQLKYISTKYLYLEASTSSRSRGYTDSELYTAIKESFGNFETVYSSSIKLTKPTYELLLKFL
jgi:FkbM family methyltransferase